MAEVILKEVYKRFGDVDVIKGIDIEIADGEFVVFVGPSGCGKSTVLRMIAGLEDVSSGKLMIGGQVVNDVQPKDRGIAMVFQSYAIFPHMSVRENVAFGLTIAGVDREEKARRVDEAARILQMQHLLDRRPSQLSGGQRQRVAIGRAIVRNPSVFLFDEPLSNLDAALRMDMRMEIGKLHEQLDATMIYVTHDQVEAMTLADRIVVLRDGVVEQVGAPMDIYHHPRNLFVAGFIGSPSMNFMTVDVVGRDNTGVTIEAAALERVTLPAAQVHEGVSARAILGVRPQYLSIGESQGAGRLHGRVSLVERLGTETVVDLELDRGGRLVAALPEDRRLEPGTELALAFDPKQAHLFALSEQSTPVDREDPERRSNVRNG